MPAIGSTPVPRPARRRLAAPGLAAALIAALLAPAWAGAKSGGTVAKVATAICVQEKRTIGKRAFRKRYGQRRATATCVRRNHSKAWRELATATGDCEEELAEFGPSDFFEGWVSFEECVLDGALPEVEVEDEGEDDDEEVDDFHWSSTAAVLS